MSLSSLVISCLALLLLAVACSAQTPGTCGITSIGGHDYSFSGIGAVSLGINPAGLNWAYTVCGYSTICSSSAWTACTGVSYNVPLALADDPIQWSFVDAQRPQLGVLAQYPLTQDPDLTSLFRQLTVLFACGPDTVAPGESGPGFAALQSGAVTGSTSEVIQYTYTVPTSILCDYYEGNIVHGSGSHVANNTSQVNRDITNLSAIISKLRKGSSIGRK